MNLDAFGLTYLFDLFSCTLYVGDHNCNVPVVVVVCWAAVVVVLLTRLVVTVKLLLQFV